jgi:hypothetical protein
VKTSEKSAEVLKRIFRKTGGNGRSLMVFDELSLEKQAALRRVARFAPEYFVVGSYEGETEWLALATEHLAWAEGPEISRLDLRKIIDAKVDLDAMKGRGRTKRQWDALTVLGADFVVDLKVEPGPPLIGLWNILLNVAATNRRDDKQRSPRGPR